jgi:hypothetical protein
MAGISGKLLNKKWRIGAQHCLYSKKGNWYHLLERFPGALCDNTGYVVFDSPEALSNCEGIARSREGKNWLNVRDGIGSLKGYVRCDF